MPFSMGSDAPDLRREMKRRFAEGNYRGALDLAEHVLATNPEDAIAEAIATESRHELKRLRNTFAPLDFEDDISSPGSGPQGPAPATVPRGYLPLSEPLEEEPASSYLVDVDIEEDFGFSDDGRRSSPPSTKPPGSQANRPTAPPGVSRSSTNLPAIRIAPAPTDDLDAAWDAPGGSIHPPRSMLDETPSADTTVALSGADLDALSKLDLDGPLTAEAADALARRMYEQFVGHEYAAAIETAQRILAFQPKERLALALESQSRTALARENALVVLVVPRAELAARNVGPHATSVLSWVDGRRTVREIAAACRVTVSDTLAILDDLRGDGIIVLGGELDQ